MTFGERREIPSLTDDEFFRILIAKPNRMKMVELMDEGHCHEFQGFGEGSRAGRGWVLDFVRLGYSVARWVSTSLRWPRHGVSM